MHLAFHFWIGIRLFCLEHIPVELDIVFLEPINNTKKYKLCVCKNRNTFNMLIKTVMFIQFTQNLDMIVKETKSCKGTHIRLQN